MYVLFFSENTIIKHTHKLSGKNDVTRFCADVNPGKGRVHDCLESHLKELETNCKKAEFAELTRDRMQHDLNMNPMIHYACGPEISAYCSDADDKTECLTKLRLGNEDDSSSTDTSTVINPRCANALDKFMAMNSRWTNLNPRIVKYCNEDMTRLCRDLFPSAALNIKNILSFFRQGKSMDYRMMSCLEKHADEIESPDCASAVKKDLVKRNSDVRFSPELQSKCSNDITRFCGDVRSVRARSARISLSLIYLLRVLTRITYITHDSHPYPSFARIPLECCEILNSRFALEHRYDQDLDESSTVFRITSTISPILVKRSIYS